MPLRPIVITFDDGYRDVFQNALPVMERYGFTGTVYLFSNAIGAGGYMNANQVKELLAKGWELGSHSKTHANLRKAGANLEEEIVNSRLALETMFSTPVLTFAYPYGAATPALPRLVRESGYSAGVGVGTSRRHTLKSRYYLSRLEVQGDYDLVKFASLLR